MGCAQNKIDYHFTPDIKAYPVFDLHCSQTKTKSDQHKMTTASATSYTMTGQIPMITRTFYESCLALHPDDVGMVVGRGGRTINGIKRDVGVMDLRVMRPCPQSGDMPWVLIQGDTQAVTKAYYEVLTIARESERRRLTEVSMVSPTPPAPTLGDIAHFHIKKDGKKSVMSHEEFGLVQIRFG